MRRLLFPLLVVALITSPTSAEQTEKSARIAKLKVEIAEARKRLAELQAELATLEAPAVKSDLDLLQGGWKQTNAKKVWTYNFTGKVLNQVSTKGVDVSVNISLDETTKPRRMTWRGDKGMAMTALYEVEGDRLKMVWSYAVHIGQWRKLQDGPNVFYMEFERAR